jgi:EAL domain-containing protein (putative c-di-GMP-specific phosphodiesterase class I)
VFVSVSIGITLGSADYESPSEMLRDADTAMFRAKARGRGTTAVFERGMHLEAVSRLQMETELRQALERGELRVHYQPIWLLAGNTIAGFEALVRWQHEERGLVPPGEFIPIAEETGLIGALGDWVLRRSCEDRQGWTRIDLPPVPVSVNLSAHQFRGGALAESVGRILDETGIRPELLELEITESTLLHDEPTVVAALSELRGRGVRVAVDDFGTGYSSLAYLGRLPVDALKIDRSFVRGIADHPGEAALTAAIVAMGHALRLRVVAEGVETERQRELLQAWGCDELQGFLFAHPMPVDALQRWWRERS